MIIICQKWGSKRDNSMYENYSEAFITCWPVGLDNCDGSNYLRFFAGER